MGLTTTQIIKKANGCLNKGMNPASAEVALGIAFFENGDIAGAVQHYEKALKINESMPEAHAGLGISFGRQGDLKKTVYHLKRAFDLSPDNSLLANWLADAYYDSGELDLAIEYYALALRHNAADSNAQNDMADAYRAKGDYQTACNLYEKTLEIDPLDTNAMLEQAQCLIQLKKNTQALTVLKKLIREFPASHDSATAMVVCGTILNSAGKFSEACDWFEKALEFFPFNTNVLLQAAVCAMNADKKPVCIKYLQKILDLNPADSRATGLMQKVARK